MGRLNPKERILVSQLKRQRIALNIIANAFSCSRVTIWYWSKQDLRTRFEIKRNFNGKISVEVEISILYMRNTFKWGTARIQQGLICLPEFMKAEMEVCIQNFYLSRTSINILLKKHKINGYKSKLKCWKFFRAKYPNELWQVDLKEFKFEGKKYYILVCIDDYSRFILLLKLFDHCPTTKELTFEIQKLNIHPEKILSDNGGQFKEQWKEWCKSFGSEAIFAHPYYPQDKGKVERTIRNLAEEFVDLLSKFPKWIENLGEWRVWFNEKRYHRGIKDYPAELYVKI